VRILTGHAAYISLSMEEKCGGVVDERAKKPLVASLGNMLTKMMKIKKWV